MMLIGVGGREILNCVLPGRDGAVDAADHGSHHTRVVVCST